MCTKPSVFSYTVYQRVEPPHARSDRPKPSCLSALPRLCCTAEPTNSGVRAACFTLELLDVAFLPA